MICNPQKAHARLRVLNLSKTLDEPTKEKIRSVLNADYMSSDESEVDVLARQEESSDSENETASVGKKNFIDNGFPGGHKNCKRSLKARAKTY